MTTTPADAQFSEATESDPAFEALDRSRRFAWAKFYDAQRKLEALSSELPSPHWSVSLGRAGELKICPTEDAVSGDYDIDCALVATKWDLDDRLVNAGFTRYLSAAEATDLAHSLLACVEYVALRRRS